MPTIPSISQGALGNRGMGKAAPAVIQIVADEGAMWVPRVASVAGAVSVQQIRANNQAIPGMLQKRQERRLP
jgi:hypothetical protein